MPKTQESIQALIHLTLQVFWFRREREEYFVLCNFFLLIEVLKSPSKHSLTLSIDAIRWENVSGCPKSLIGIFDYQGIQWQLQAGITWVSQCIWSWVCRVLWQISKSLLTCTLRRKSKLKNTLLSLIFIYSSNNSLLTTHYKPGSMLKWKHTDNYV